MHRRVQPTDVFEPVAGLYTQLIGCAEGERFEIAGTLPYYPDGSLDEGLAEQSAVVMANIGRTLHAGDLERSDIVRLNTFTTDMTTSSARAWAWSSTGSAIIDRPRPLWRSRDLRLSHGGPDAAGGEVSCRN